MNKIEYDYRSALAPYMTSYIKEYEALGHDPKMVRFVLRTFDQYLLSIDYKNGSTISDEIYNGWLERWDNMNQSTKYHCAAYLVKFIKYLCNHGLSCHIPLLPNPGKGKYVPYIFSHEEIEKIFKACDDWRERTHKRDSHQLVMPALLRLLYSTGIRIGEAVNIQMRDVKLDKHCIVIRNTKNNRERLAPVNETMGNVLLVYIKNRNRIKRPELSTPSSYLFVKADGTRCNPSTILLRFQALCNEVGIKYHYGLHGLRIHDIRHTACVHALIKMVKSGKDPYCCLPSLSVYMGHYDLQSTEYYLRLAQMSYPDIVQLTEPLSCSFSDIINNAMRSYEERTI